VSTELEEKVINVIRANIENKYEVNLHSDLRTDLEVDSFGAIMIFNDLEETFGIEIKDADIKSIAKVADIVGLLATKYLPLSENL
jgi:acyl carrier protein